MWEWLKWKIKFRTKLKFYQWVLVAFFIAILATTAYGLVTAKDLAWYERVDPTNGVMALLVALVSWFAVKTFRTVEKTIGVLFEENKARQKAHDEIRTEFDQLQGKCKERTKC